MSFNLVIAFFGNLKVKSLNCVQLFAIPWTVAYQASLSMGFFRPECWSELPFPPLVDLLNPGLDYASLVSPELAGEFFYPLSHGEAAPPPPPPPAPPPLHMFLEGRMYRV